MKIAITEKFERRRGTRGAATSWVRRHRDGTLSICLEVPAGGGRTTVIDIPIGAARDAIQTLQAAVDDARDALDAVCRTGRRGDGS